MRSFLFLVVDKKSNRRFFEKIIETKFQFAVKELEKTYPIDKFAYCIKSIIPY